jgi:RNA polymerase sigma factor (sigma-70 family)
MLNSFKFEVDNDVALRQLVDSASMGDTAALELLLAAVTPRVIASCRRILGSSHADIDDAAQETLIGFARSLGNYRSECSVLSYATSVAIRTCLGIRRRHLRRVSLAMQAPQPEDGLPSFDPLVNPALVAQQRELLRDLIASLSPILAEALTLRILLGLPLAEVAEISGVPMNTIRSRVRLAKEALRSMIEADPVAVDLLKDDE